MTNLLCWLGFHWEVTEQVTGPDGAITFVRHCTLCPYSVQLHEYDAAEAAGKMASFP